MGRVQRNVRLTRYLLLGSWASFDKHLFSHIAQHVRVQYEVYEQGSVEIIHNY